MEPVRLESLPPLARELATDAIDWMEPYGNAKLNLLRYPSSHGHYGNFDAGKTTLHPLRESVWWASGLLLRNRGDDAARAEKILEASLPLQFDEPGTPYHGTFSRAPEDPHPPGMSAVMWRDYDPNWRQFIGTTFLLLLEMVPDRLSPGLAGKLEASVRLAVEGEVPGRLTAHYTNIAMMHAILLVNAGARAGRSDWTERGVALAREIHDLFREHGAFDEYNSPTYYAVDLYALRLWRLISPRPELAEWAAEIEHDLWCDIAAYYHPRLRNVCGPFDRAYGMDMTRYIGGLGMFLRLELPKEIAPLPDPAGDFDHAHDFTLAPMVAMVGADIPDEARVMLRELEKDRLTEHSIDRERIATAFLGRDWMWGGERGAKKCGWDQYHFATAHWRQPDGGVGWMRLENGTFIDATATPAGLQIEANNGADTQKLTWHFSTAPKVSGETWVLPGMTIRLKGDRMEWTADESGRALACTLAPRTARSFALEFVPGGVGVLTKGALT